MSSFIFPFLYRFRDKGGEEIAQPYGPHPHKRHLWNPVRDDGLQRTGERRMEICMDHVGKNKCGPVALRKERAPLLGLLLGNPRLLYGSVWGNGWESHLITLIDYPMIMIIFLI